MDLKKFLPSKEKDTFEYYWALVIEPGWVQAGIWRINQGSAQVVLTSPAAAWELEGDLISATDTALSSAIQDFPEELNEPSKTVFAVVSSWVDGGQIKEEHLEKIKKVCKELSLKPVGFVVLSEAISHFYKSEEGSPLNAVLLGVYKESVELSVFRLGSLVGSSEVARSVSMVDDITEGLSRFNLGDEVPSRFILYDGKEGELEEVRQALLKVDWVQDTEFRFLHTPKVEIIDPVKKVHAASLAGASEMADVGKVESVVDAADKDSLRKHDERYALPLEDAGEKSMEDIGFSEDQDTSFVGKKETVSDASRNTPKMDEAELDNIRSVGEEPRIGRKLPLTKLNPLGVLGGLGGKAGKFIGGISQKLKFFNFGKSAITIGVIFFILFVIGGFLFWWFYPKAVVTVYISPKRLDEKIEIKVDPSAGGPNTSDRLIPGEVGTTTVSGERTKSTTGTKTVGDKASGEVTIYRVGSQLTLSSGMTVTGPENLKFSLDESVTIASGSAGTPGTTKAKVTAEDIGAQYNLASNSTFTVSNYSTSDMEAKNESSFSGGSSREISAVVEDDIESLEDELTDELSDSASNRLSDDLGSNKILISESVTTNSRSKKFSNEVGDEASTLKLELELEATGLIVDESQLKNMLIEVMQDKVPEGFVLRGEQVNVGFEFREEDNGIYFFEAVVVANLLPEVNPDEIAENLTGKYPALAEDYLTKEIPGFVRVQIRRKPSFPGRLGTLPRVAKNIDVEISAER
jgi:hypothetical protein